MVKKSSVKDDSSTFDDIETSDNYEVIESITSKKDNYEVRRRLENVLEDKALERLLNSDFYD